MFKKLCPLSHIRMYAVYVSATVLYTVRRLSTYVQSTAHTYDVCGTCSKKKATDFDNLPRSTTDEVIYLNILSTTVSCSQLSVQPDGTRCAPQVSNVKPPTVGHSGIEPKGKQERHWQRGHCIWRMDCRYTDGSTHFCPIQIRPVPACAATWWSSGLDALPSATAHTFLSVGKGQCPHNAVDSQSFSNSSEVCPSDNWRSQCL